MRSVIRDVPVRLAIAMASDCIAVAAVSTSTRTWSNLMPCAVCVGRPSSAMLPLASSAHQMFMHASTAGYAKEDDSAVIKIFPGITLPGAKASGEA